MISSIIYMVGDPLLEFLLDIKILGILIFWSSLGGMSLDSALKSLRLPLEGPPHESYDAVVGTI